MASAEQQQWQEITAAVRAQLAKQAELMPAMDIGEVAQLIGAIDNAMWTEVKAAAYDEEVEERKQALVRAAAYGGGERD